MRKVVLGLVVLSSFILNLSASEIVLFNNNFTLYDTDTDEEAQGVKTTGIYADINNLYFSYEKPKNDEQKELSNYANRITETENYVQKLKAGLKLTSNNYRTPQFFPYGDNPHFVIEYNKDVYQTKFNTFTKFYSQELVFFGEKVYNKWTGSNRSVGIFLHNNSKETLTHSNNNYEEIDTKNVFGLLYQINNVFIGKRLGLLFDDMKVQYQLSGGNDYFLSLGVGIAFKTKKLQIFYKTIGEMTTDTSVTKQMFGLNIKF